MHRDIKPANILIDKGTYKICDYGLSTVAMKNPHLKEKFSCVGSNLYLASEVILEREYNSSVDVFAAGVVLFEIIFQATPWPSKNLKNLLQRRNN